MFEFKYVGKLKSVSPLGVEFVKGKWVKVNGDVAQHLRKAGGFEERPAQTETPEQSEE